MAAEPVDWPGLMRLGLGGLRLAPDVFWAMTPCELQMALEGAGLAPAPGTGPMRRGRLAELMAVYPDGGGPASGAGGQAWTPAGASAPDLSPTRGERSQGGSAARTAARSEEAR